MAFHLISQFSKRELPGNFCVLDIRVDNTNFFSDRKNVFGQAVTSYIKRLVFFLKFLMYSIFIAPSRAYQKGLSIKRIFCQHSKDLDTLFHKLRELVFFPLLIVAGLFNPRVYSVMQKNLLTSTPLGIVQKAFDPHLPMEKKEREAMVALFERTFFFRELDEMDLGLVLARMDEQERMYLPFSQLVRFTNESLEDLFLWMKSEKDLTPIVFSMRRAIEEKDRFPEFSLKVLILFFLRAPKCLFDETMTVSVKDEKKILHFVQHNRVRKLLVMMFFERVWEKPILSELFELFAKMPDEQFNRVFSLIKIAKSETNRVMFEKQLACREKIFERAILFKRFLGNSISIKGVIHILDCIPKDRFDWLVFLMTRLKSRYGIFKIFALIERKRNWVYVEELLQALFSFKEKGGFSLEELLDILLCIPEDFFARTILFLKHDLEDGRKVRQMLQWIQTVPDPIDLEKVMRGALFFQSLSGNSFTLEELLNIFCVPGAFQMISSIIALESCSEMQEVLRFIQIVCGKEKNHRDKLFHAISLSIERFDHKICLKQLVASFIKIPEDRIDHAIGLMARLKDLGEIEQTFAFIANCDVYVESLLEMAFSCKAKSNSSLKQLLYGLARIPEHQRDRVFQLMTCLTGEEMEKVFTYMERRGKKRTIYIGKWLEKALLLRATYPLEKVLNGLEKISDDQIDRVLSLEDLNRRVSKKKGSLFKKIIDFFLSTCKKPKI